MDKTYQPEKIENQWYQTWEERGYFAPAGEGDPFCIMIPPPNVTGSLHMGHAFQHTLMDALIRHRRMKGNNTLWQVGGDHAGIATQMVVERNLANDEGKTRHDLGREAFLDKVWEWKEQSGGTITSQMRRLGTSVDWDHERFTMDDGFYRAVQEVFVQLHDEGLYIYRGKRLGQLGPQTAHRDFRPGSGERGRRRPLLALPLPADAWPDHDRGQGLPGGGHHPPGNHAGRHRRGREPRGRALPAPDWQQRAPATGQPGNPGGRGRARRPDHGQRLRQDHPRSRLQRLRRWGQRQNLTLINILTPDAAIRETAEVFNADGTPNEDIDGSMPAAYAGLNRFDARERILADLDSEGLLHQTEKHTLKVPRGDRSGLIIEPLLTDQWFVATKPLAEPAIKAVEDGDIRFVPEQYANMYFAWMREIQEWCISRQLWWGHRIPAWYDAEGNVYVGRDEAEVREKYSLPPDLALNQDEDVLDTWFSSALWTFGTLGWPDDTERLRTFHPTSVLVTGFDIIFFWVARMIMMTLQFMKDEDGTPQVPFKDVYVTGLIRDEHGDKMSKSKGNVLDPMDMIDGIGCEDLVAKRTANLMQPQLAEKIAKNTRKEFPEGIQPHGTDALRFTLAALASTGRDINWDMKRLEGYRNFCNKLWNAARYVLMNTEGEDCGIGSEPVELSLADRWILSRLQTCIEETNSHFDQYRFDRIAHTVYEFRGTNTATGTWSCPSRSSTTTTKPPSAQARHKTHPGPGPENRPAPRAPADALHHRGNLAARRPLAGVPGETVMLQPYPEPHPELEDADAEADAEWVKGVVEAVRNIRGEMNISPAKALPVLCRSSQERDHERLEANRTFLASPAKAKASSG